MKAKVRTLFCIAVLSLFTTVLRAADSGWTVNPYDYQYDMTVYAKLVIDEADVSDYTNYEIAAFVGVECRGVGEIQSQDGYTWVYLRVRSNSASGETVSFKIFDKTTGKEMRIQETVAFASSGQEGMPSRPITLSKAKYTLGDVNDDGKINIADVTAVLSIMAGNEGDLIKDAADVNEDGKINIADVTAILSIMAGN